MEILHIVGARPNFMKAAPVMKALERIGDVSQILVHTGQHYDANLSDVIFKQLGLSKPDINLGVGSSSHALQTASIMFRLEPLLLEKEPDLVLVYGDVNSTVAAALVCSKLMIPVGHVEAGLRSFDRTMPEEINRVLTDQLADLLFTPSKDGDQNLRRQGIPEEKIHFVGNVMIDTLIRLLPQATAERVRNPRLGTLTRDGGPYCLVTLHRPSNVDDPQMLARIIRTLRAISKDVPVVFPVHPRTKLRASEFGLDISSNKSFHLVDPMGYLEFIAFQQKATFVITDSGGIQEETTYMGIPCLTVRNNTERPITVGMGTNLLVGQDMDRLIQEVHQILSGKLKRGFVPPLWDGKASQRIAEVISEWVRRY